MLKNILTATVLSLAIAGASFSAQAATKHAAKDQECATQAKKEANGKKAAYRKAYKACVEAKKAPAAAPAAK